MDNPDEGGSENDLLLVCEVCEKEGPKLIAYADRIGTMDADQFFAIQDSSVQAEVSRFVVSVLATDHNYQRSGSNEAEWGIPPDCQVLLHEVRFLNKLLAAFIYHFTLPDIAARGHVRPHCAIYLTHQPSKLVPYYKKLRIWVENAVSGWKLHTYRYFVTRASAIIEGTNEVLTYFKRKKKERLAEAAAQLPPTQSCNPGTDVEPPPQEGSESISFGIDYINTPTTPGGTASGSWLSRLGGLWRPQNSTPIFSSQENQIPLKAIEEERASLRRMIETLKSYIPDAAIEDPRGRNGLVNLDIPRWISFLTTFIEKNPSEEALSPLREWVTQEVWNTGLTRLVLVLQVLDRTDMDLLLMEQDWRSVMQSPQPNSCLGFGGRVALGTDLQSELPYTPAPDTNSLLTSPFAHPPSQGLHALLSMYPVALKHLAFSILRGRPVVIIGPEEGTEAQMGSIRWIISVLRMFVPSSGDPNKASFYSSQVVPWKTNSIVVSDLCHLRLIGIESATLLKHPVQKYVTMLHTTTGVFSGPLYSGRWLEEVFASKKVWDSDETLATFTHSWLLKIGLTAAIVHHSTLLKGPPVVPYHHVLGNSVPQSPIAGSLEVSSPVRAVVAGAGGLFNPSPGSGHSIPSEISVSESASRTESPPVGIMDEALANTLKRRPTGVVGSSAGSRLLGPSVVVGHSNSLETILRDLGVPNGDVDIIRHLVRVIRDASVTTQNKTLQTSFAMPPGAPAQYAEETPGAFPILKLDLNATSTLTT